MPLPPRAVFFDVDGVLIDSLPQHLRICRDKAAEYGLDVIIPGVEQFRELVRRGVRVSPMRDFFLAVGFPSDLADRAVVEYDRDFMRDYRPPAFEGAELTLSRLADAGLELGLVTSNIEANVAPALRAVMDRFEPNCLFFYDRYPEPKTKSWCLNRGAEALGLTPDLCLYVGDQPADAVAAQDAGTRFLGVTYGWGISKQDIEYELVGDVREIAGKILLKDYHVLIG